jgi:uncharacterized protein (TIGR00369 family)
MNKQPNSAQCFVCGVHNPVGLKLSFYEAASGEVVAGYTPPQHFEGFPGVLHGGVISALLDEAGWRAVMVGDPNRFTVTARLDVRYRQPTPIGQPLRIVGRVVKRRGRLALAQASITLPDGTVTAEADLTLVDPPEPLQVDGDLEALGWRVYPDSVPAGEAE